MQAILYSKGSLAMERMEGSRETPPRVLCAALKPSAQKRQGPVGVGPEEGDKNDQRNGTPLL